MLEEMHPDVARVVWMNQRWHHWVDYSVYKKQRLIRNTEFPIGNYEYGMEFKKTNDVAFDEEEED
jgi:hypothetical protein